SIPKKLRAWQNPNARFLILRDNDRGDCKARKKKIETLIKDTNCIEKSKIRIVCQELEAWYLGDLSALEMTDFSNPNISNKQDKQPFSDPDNIDRPLIILDKLTKKSFTPKSQKSTLARSIAQHLSMTNNRSHSFNQTISAINALVLQLNEI
ncbi:MAG: DUF4276 family protein, partial [Pseudomonadota bacterium]